MDGETPKPLCLGFAIWSTKRGEMSYRRHIYRTKGIAQQYCREWNGDVPVPVYATSYTKEVEVPLVTS